MPLETGRTLEDTDPLASIYLDRQPAGRTKLDHISLVAVKYPRAHWTGGVEQARYGGGEGS